MTELPDVVAGLAAGPRTDLQIIALLGASVTDRGDHLIVRSPHNPDFHWGNHVRVTTGDPADADRWLRVFDAEFPGASYVAIGLPSLPAVDGYAARGVEVSTDDVLTSTELPEQRPLAAGYTSRPLSCDDDWDQVVRNGLAENARDGRYDPVLHERFLRGQADASRALVARGAACWFGAFAGDELAADLGIVVLGTTARYQAVGTAAPHRRRGLAGHLLGVAARWAADHGAREWVIVTETTNPAGRLYRSVGFAEATRIVGAYRTRGLDR